MINNRLHFREGKGAKCVQIEASSFSRKTMDKGDITLSVKCDYKGLFIFVYSLMRGMQLEINVGKHFASSCKKASSVSDQWGVMCI